MRITIIGCGNIGSALAEQLSQTHQLFLYDRNSEKSAKLEQQNFGRSFIAPEEALLNTDIVFLAIKPQNLPELAQLIEDDVTTKHVVISLLAGVSIATLQGYFINRTIVRMMPNLAITFGEGLIGLAVDGDLRPEMHRQLTLLCEKLGKLVWLPESKMNAFTALAGSGPAFVFAMVESIVDAGIAMGFSSTDAQSLVHQMIKGSLALLEHSGKHPGELKWQVASPSGTTIEGLRKFEEFGVRSGIIETFLAANDRAKAIAG